jgi:hypothetical protein
MSPIDRAGFKEERRKRQAWGHHKKKLESTHFTQIFVSLKNMESWFYFQLL